MARIHSVPRNLGPGNTLLLRDPQDSALLKALREHLPTVSEQPLAMFRIRVSRFLPTTGFDRDGQERELLAVLTDLTPRLPGEPPAELTLILGEVCQGTARSG